MEELVVVASQVLFLVVEQQVLVLVGGGLYFYDVGSRVEGFVFRNGVGV
jgi:hypothetical protein